MADLDGNFFDELRPWSRLKNRILGSYMSPYLAKVARRRERIILVDAFAGPGRYSDGTAGSPLIICQAAERYAKGKYDAYFFNNNEDHHDLLKSIINKQQLYFAHAKFGDGIEQLNQLIAGLRDETLFLYIDPYGLDCEFEVLRPLLEREKSFSTEIFINLHMPISHRLSSRHAVKGKADFGPRIQSYHEKLTRVYGGNYWRNDLLDDAKTKEREKELVDHYREKLSSSGYLTYTGACPIREKTDSATKYTMIFASPHPDALLLLNDEMCKAFNDHMHSHWVKDTLFADSSWIDWRNAEKLQGIVVEYVEKYPEHSRIDLWQRIVVEYFMLFTSSEYKKAVKAACDSGEITCVTPVVRGSERPTKRLNDNCVFKLPDQQSML